jgi:hypothetical protein
LKDENVFKALKDAEALVKKLKDLMSLPDDFKSFVSNFNK